MKSTLLISSIAIAAASAVAAPNDSSTPSTPAPLPKPAISSRVTITIDSGGKKETREIDLGNATTIKVEGLTGSKTAGNTGGAQVSGALTPWLGVAPDELSEDLRAQLPIEEGAGLILRSVTPGSPAAQAGLQKDDVLVKFDDQLLTNARQLRALVNMKKDGEKVRLTYLRKGKSSTAEAQIRLREGSEPGDDPWNISRFLSSVIGKSGISNLTDPLKLQSKMVVVDKDGHVLISGTQRDLSAVTAQIEKILRAAGVDDKTISETERAIADAAKAATNNVASSIGNADGDVARQLKESANQVAKSLEKARAAADRVRKQAEETRERLEKQRDPQKAPPAQ